MDSPNPIADSSTPTPKTQSAKDQYHHFVPRFILRRFSEQPTVKKVQQKRRGKKAASTVIQDPIYSYSIPTGTLTTTSVSTSYGVKNLYKDLKNQGNVHQVEQKLSVLENHAARSISELHKIIETRDSKMRTAGSAEPAVFQIQRRYLNYLRKFLFIMYLRKDGYKGSQFNEDHPENAQIAKWILNFRKKHELDASEVWLYVLERFLDTPHTELVEQGRIASGKQMGMGLYKEVDPSLEHYEAISYFGEANSFFLAFWEAAEGEEFVISDNSFGLIEGMRSTAMPGPVPFPFHRLYVVSPKVALVLCSITTRPDFPRDQLRQMGDLELLLKGSMLYDAPHKAAKVTDVNGAMAYRGDRGEKYEEDLMEFEIPRLSVEITHKVNAIILGNVRDTGTVTFHTTVAVLRTLESFSKDSDFRNQMLYEPLVKELFKRHGGSEFSMDSGLGIRPPRSPLFDADWKGNGGAQDPPSLPSGLWDMYFTIYSKLNEKRNDPELRVYRSGEDRVIITAAVKIAQTPDDLNAQPARLRKEMSDIHVMTIFKFLRAFLTEFLEIELPRIFTEVVMLSFLIWLLKNRRLMFQMIEREIGFQLKEYLCMYLIPLVYLPKLKVPMS